MVGGGVLLVLDGCGRQGVLRLDDGAISGGALGPGDGCAGCEVLLFSDGCLDTGLTQDSSVLRWVGKALRRPLDRAEETLRWLGVRGLFIASAGALAAFAGEDVDVWLTLRALAIRASPPAAGSSATAVMGDRCRWLFSVA